MPRPRIQYKVLYKFLCLSSSMVEQKTLNLLVWGSSPQGGTTLYKKFCPHIGPF